MNKKIILSMLILIMLGLFYRGTIFAKVFTVTTSDDKIVGSLRAALITTNENNEDNIIHLPSGIYLLIGKTNEDKNQGGDLDIDTSHQLTIIGNGAQNTIIDANFIDRVIHVINGTVFISGITIMHGANNQGAGGGIINDGILNLTDCIIRDNRTTNITSNNCAGGIWNKKTLSMTRCQVIYNQTSCDYDDDFLGNYGGGIVNTGSQTLIECAINYNTTGNGATHVTGGHGGGICNYGKQNLINCKISYNKTGDGGNRGGFGGGIYTNSGSESTLDACTISNNSTGKDYEDEYYYGGLGGGIYCEGKLSISRSTISYNKTGDHAPGGGIANRNGDILLKNCTVSNNTTMDSEFYGGEGGGIYNYGDQSKLTLINCTVCYNITGEWYKSGINGGGISNINGSVYIKNTIIAENQVPQLSEGPDIWGIIKSQGYNLIGNSNQCTITGIQTGNIIGIPPLLAPLADNGGPTQTHALLPDSPAIDAGNSNWIPGDQRGYPRPIDIRDIVNISDGSDIGAYETESLPSIAGKITFAGKGLAGSIVTLSKNGGEVITDNQGNYEQMVTYGWSGSATPTKPGYSFTPILRSYSKVTKAEIDQDYEAQVLIPPRLSLNRSTMYFGSDTAGHQTGDATFFISNSGGGTLKWDIQTNKNWLACTPASGNGPASVAILINSKGLAKGTYSGIIKINALDAIDSPQQINITLTIYDTGTSNSPFGAFETPIDRATVMSSIAVTGWCIDDIGIENVKIYRNPLTEEGDGLIYIGDAVLVEGARPDIEAAYPGYPNNYKAGWGYMLLTNALPNRGNGTFTLYSNVIDMEGNEITLGTKTIQCDNSHAIKPFGAIDLPSQGGTATGSNYKNIGWALTPQPNRIPIDGSTITIWVDGVSIGHPVYNRPREDVRALFTDYMNSSGPGGNFTLDTTQFENGVHTVAWSVKDNAGNIDGIGSRYFTIQNTGSNQPANNNKTSIHLHNRVPYIVNSLLGYDPLPLMDRTSPIRVKKGFNTQLKPQLVYPDSNGYINLEIFQMERIEISLTDYPDNREGIKNTFTNEPVQWVGYEVVRLSQIELKPLPVGSTFKPREGEFSWLPGPAALEKYQFLFIATVDNETIYQFLINLVINPLPPKK